jgi:hypothetical protein
MDIDEFHNLNVKICTEMLTAKHGQEDIIPQIMLFKDGKVTVIAVAQGGEKAGDALASSLRLAEQMKPDMITVMNLAWYKEVKAEDAKNYHYHRGDAAKAKDRQEAIVLVTQDSYGEMRAYFAKVIRKDNNIMLEEMPEFAKNPYSLSGRLIPDLRGWNAKEKE